MVLWQHVICGRHFWEKGVKPWMTPWGRERGRKSYGRKKILEEVFSRGSSNSGGQHGIAPLDKCGYNCLLLVFRLQLSRILLSGRSVGSKKLLSIHSVVH